MGWATKYIWFSLQNLTNILIDTKKIERINGTSISSSTSLGRASCAATVRMACSKPGTEPTTEAHGNTDTVGKWSSMPYIWPNYFQLGTNQHCYGYKCFILPRFQLVNDHKCSITQCWFFSSCRSRENLGEPKKLGTKTTWRTWPSESGLSGHPRMGFVVPKTRRWQSKSRIKPQLGY